MYLAVNSENTPLNLFSDWVGSSFALWLNEVKVFRVLFTSEAACDAKSSTVALYEDRCSSSFWGCVAALLYKNSWLQLSCYTVGNSLCLLPTEGKQQEE